VQATRPQPALLLPLIQAAQMNLGRGRLPSPFANRTAGLDGDVGSVD